MEENETWLTSLIFSAWFKEASFMRGGLRTGPLSLPWISVPDSAKRCKQGRPEELEATG